MAKTYVQTFEVEGRFPFPVDMLRYDYCYPVREAEDSYNIAASIRRDTNGPVRIKLRRTIEHKGNLPTSGRWSSFGWTVIESTIKVESY
jgi:hypothetical protein